MRHPLLYQLNTRVFLREQGLAAGRTVSFDDIPDCLLGELREQGFTWLYLLGVWQTGGEALAVSRSNADVRAEGMAALADFSEEDIIGSPFAVQRYEPNSVFGGREALERLRERMRDHGLKLMLDVGETE